jgi:DNA-binding CsgD family transcriptional regulator/PAS domain-containing protein
MGREEEKHSELIGAIYDSAMDAAVWPDLLRRIAEHIDAKAAVFRVSDVVSNQVHMGYTYGHEESYLRVYKEHYIHIDPFRPALKRFQPGCFYPGHLAIPYSEARKFELYNDLMLPNGLKYTVSAFALREHTLAYQIAIQRGDPIGDWTGAEVDKLNRLIPHLQRAFKINQHLSHLVHQRQKLEHLLDQLSTGVLLCDEDGLVCYLNQKAEAIISSRLGLDIVSGKLVAMRPQESSKLQKIIRDAVGNTADKEMRLGAAMTLQPESIDARPLAILVAPLNPDNQLQLPFLSKRACAIVFMGTPALPGVIDAGIVGMLYGLTEAEAKLATELARGKSLEDICSFNGTSYNTGRSHLKSIFAKTRTSRQAELVNLILTSPASI